MSNRQLNPPELQKANRLLNRKRNKLKVLGKGDRELLFVYRRKIYKELTYDERGKPSIRRKLKDHKRKEQNGLCALCGERLPHKYVVLDRFNAVDGYTQENTRLICRECDIRIQKSKGYQ